MNKKARMRIGSALLTLVMLVSLVPTAFAVSYDDYGTMRMYIDFDEDYYLVYDGDFDEEDLYDDSDYFVIKNEDGGPTVRDDYSEDNVERDELWKSAYYDEYDIDDVYFDTSDYDYDEDIYEYTIYGYDEDGDRVGYMTLYLDLSDDGYSSSSDGDIYAKTDSWDQLDMDEISDEIYDFANGELKGDPYYVQFTDWDNGTMYDGEQKTSTSDRYYFYKSDAGTNEYYLDDAYFEADNSSKESTISFRVYSDKYSGSNRDYVTGTIYVNSDGSGSSSDGDIYAETDRNGILDLEDVGEDIYDYVDDELKSNEYPYWIRFYSSDGYLYDDDEDDMDGVRVYFSDSSSYYFEDYIYFEPDYDDEESEITFTAEGDEGTRVSGTIIVNGDGSSSGDITYSTAANTSVTFDADDFEDLVPSGYTLDYVKFTPPSSSKGTLYTTSSERTAVTSRNEFDADALDEVTFAPKSGVTGTVSISFTMECYKSRSCTRTVRGTVEIKISAGTLNAIQYTLSGTRVTFDATDFTTALRTKTTKGLSYVTFTLPSATQGTLYYNTNTRVTASTQYKASGSTNSLDKVSFVPASTASGSVTINYTARDTSGNDYSGTVIIKTFAGVDTTLTYSTTGTAVKFTANDFNTACTKKLGTTLSSVQFTLPSSSQGTLYYGYGTNQQTRVTGTSLYLANLHLPYISFLPKAGFSGTVTISYTGLDIMGSSYVGTIKVTVTPPTKSATYTDVTASWVAPSVDFLQANGVYSGVVSGTTLNVNSATTRGEVMQMIYNAFNLKNKGVTVTSNFTDVPASHKYYTAINTGYALGIAQGVGDGKYNPDAPITRQDACTLLYRAFSTLGLSMSNGTASDLNGFKDASKVASYAVNGVAGMVKSGIIVGDQNSNFNPLANLTRGEMSIIVHRAMTL